MSFLLLALACNLPFAAPPAPPPPPQLPGVMVGRLTLTDGRFTLFNDSDTTWSSVVIHPDGGAMCNVGLVHPKDQAGLNLTNCSGTVGPVVTTALITADQGTLSVSFSPPVSVGVGGVTQPMPIDPTVAMASGPSPDGPPGSPAPATGTTPVAPPTGAASSSPPASAPPSTGTTSGRSGATAASGTAGGTPEATAAAATPSTPPTGGAMKATAAVSGGFGPARRVTIRNTSSFGWTACRVTLNGTYTYSMKDMTPGMDEGIMAFKFKDGRGNALTSNAEIDKVNVACAQGAVTVSPS